MTKIAGKISAVMPIYCAEKYLEEAIESVLKQDYENWELLLIVKESEDKSSEIAIRYANEESKVRFVKNDEIGAGKARNLGMKEADGEYIIFIDADDYLPNESIFSQYIKLAGKISADIFISNYARLWDGKILSATSHSCFSSYPREAEEFRFRGFFSVGTLSYVWGRMYRKAFLEEHSIVFSDYTYAEDKLFNMQCYASGARYIFLEDIGYIYRRNENSISYQYNPEISQCWIGICKTFKNCIIEQEKEEIYDSMIWYTLSFAAFFDAKMKYEQYKRSLRVIRKTLKSYRDDEFGKEYFKKFARLKNKKGPEQKMWKIFMKGFTMAMRFKCYLLISIGMKILIDCKVDEMLSDTGRRE